MEIGKTKPVTLPEVIPAPTFVPPTRKDPVPVERERDLVPVGVPKRDPVRHALRILEGMRRV